MTYFLLLGTRVLTNILDIAGVAAIGTLAAAGASGFLGQAESTFLGITIQLGSPRTLLVVMAIVAGLFITKAVLSIFMLRALVRFLATVEVSAATDIARHLFTSGLQRMREYSKSEVQWATTTSTSVTFSGVLGSLGILFTESGLLIMMVGFFFIVDPFAAAGITIYFAVVVLVFQLIINTSLKRAGNRSATGSVGVTQAALDLFDGFREISVLLKQEHYLEKFRHARHTQATGDATLRFLYSVPRFFVETALVIGALAFVAWQLVRGELVDGLVAVGIFLTGGVRIMAALLPLQAAFSGLKSQAEQAKLGQEILVKVQQSARTQPEPIPLAGDKAKEILGKEKGLSVEIANASFTHPGNTRPTLHQITLEIPAGGYVALVGPSGAGKTTLADLILGLNAPDSGQALVEGIPAPLVRTAIPGLMSYVPQKPGLVSGTIAENVALGLSLSDVDRERVKAVLRLAELGALIDSLPDGIDTPLGKHADSLSGGQIQRLGLARALYTEPRLIVLDEATSALDAEAEASISETITSLGDGATVVVIAHRLSTVQKADTVYVLDEGRVLASGTFREIRKTVPMIEEYVRLMSFDEE
jgi:ABC-type multidrug transport system fused ATPase/permease subunit